PKMPDDVPADLGDAVRVEAGDDGGEALSFRLGAADVLRDGGEAGLDQGELPERLGGREALGEMLRQRAPRVADLGELVPMGGPRALLFGREVADLADCVVLVRDALPVWRR